MELIISPMNGLEVFRKRSGQNQSALARSLGCAPSVVNNWESGEKKPSYDMIKRLLELGATIEELFGIDCSISCPKAQKETIAPSMGDILRRLETLERDRLDRSKAVG